MMETQVLIQEIQKKHQITLKPDDPVFVAVTLNDLLLSHYIEKFQALLEEQNKLVVSEGIERLNQASAMGSEMINRSLEALCQTLEENTQQFADQIVLMNNTEEQKQNTGSKHKKYFFYLLAYCALLFGFFMLGILFHAFFA
jgi:DNA anti-recombination protein RmuC